MCAGEFNVLKKAVCEGEAILMCASEAPSQLVFLVVGLWTFQVEFDRIN